VDDGIATGSTARAACQVARARGAKRVVLAAPVAPKEWTRRLGDAADEYVCVATPEPFFAIGAFYGDFSPTSEEDVVDCLREIPTPPPVIDLRLACDEHVKVKAGPVILDGHLTVPENAKGMIVFAHGSGSSARSPRNQHVAAVLNQAGLATLLFDLLTPIEALDRSKVFDVDLLAKRLTDATHWLEWVPAAQGLPIAFFGASTGAAAALTAAATLGHDITAVVSRGGRPDLADRDLPRVVSPTLLIVGGKDDIVLELNQNVITRMHCESNLVIVPGATHLFDEPGTLEQAATLARDWFVAHFATARAGSSTR
jgi:putative phosphoribosyl transferase